jgi:hypothetical protein
MRLGVSLTQGSRRCQRVPIVQLTSPPLPSAEERALRLIAARSANRRQRTPDALQPVQDGAQRHLGRPRPLQGYRSHPQTYPRLSESLSPQPDPP